MSNIGKQAIKIKASDKLTFKITSYNWKKSNNNTNEKINTKLAGVLAQALGASSAQQKKELAFLCSLKTGPANLGPAVDRELKRVLISKGSVQKSLFYPSYFKLKLENLRGAGENEMQLWVDLEEGYRNKKNWKKYWGTFRQNIQNTIEGLVLGYRYTLKLKGVGYRATLINDELHLNLGFSHPIKVSIPSYIKVSLAGGTEIIVQGDNKVKTSQWAHQVRLIKPSSKDHYKGAGISVIKVNN